METYIIVSTIKIKGKTKKIKIEVTQFFKNWR